ncbi:hypothetical protein [Loigolactobacillus bifermentans]|uniref:Uncharacterized protein n=1 Tax=Loigolactobacillus bifermentans DSM 20003 TaxID=1423726 RepID=A0A0R1H8U2_9LACO|nr:hypothetical protein [Loigolactobacillus bifermentans]KRK39978.1 hypothetical protein FC07_GL001775 [Loigolactobacillus bifermentans DSM 20003]QGG59673.1 hypothetical protein LB003_03790 [Loigolactobacillus bifermentans]
MSKATKEGMDFLVALEMHYGMSLAEKGGVSEVELYRLRKTLYPDMAIKAKTHETDKQRKRRKRTVLVDEEVLEIYKTHNLTDTAVILHTSTPRISTILKKHGVLRTRRNSYRAVILPNLSLIKQLASKGYSLNKIGAELNVHPASLIFARDNHVEVRQALAEGMRAWERNKKLLREKTLKERVRDV